jgi:hypothetical protein
MFNLKLPWKTAINKKINILIFYQFRLVVPGPACGVEDAKKRIGKARNFSIFGKEIFAFAGHSRSCFGILRACG